MIDYAMLDFFDIFDKELLPVCTAIELSLTLQLSTRVSSRCSPVCVGQATDLLLEIDAV